MGFLNWALKMLVSIAFDVMDFFMPPGIGTAYDLAGGVIGLILWKGPGALQFLELIDITDRIDGLIPTLTIAGLLSIKEFRN